MTYSYKLTILVLSSGDNERSGVMLRFACALQRPESIPGDRARPLNNVREPAAVPRWSHTPRVVDVEPETRTSDVTALVPVSRNAALRTHGG